MIFVVIYWTTNQQLRNTGREAKPTQGTQTSLLAVATTGDYSFIFNKTAI